MKDREKSESDYLKQPGESVGGSAADSSTQTGGDSPASPGGSGNEEPSDATSALAGEVTTGDEA